MFFTHWVTGSTGLRSLREKKQTGEPWDCPSLLLGASFQAAAPRGTETEADSLTELRRQRVKFGDVETARICGQNTEGEGP